MILKKIFIPCAGIGSRLENITKDINKALVSINHKPVISHIIENFNKDVTFVIALGHKGELLKDYLNCAHHDRKFKFVKINNFKGPKSSLGLTLNICKKFLKEPFIFCSCDTFFTKNIKYLNYDWIAYDIKNKNLDLYRKLNISKGKIIITEKNSKSKNCYIGLAGIFDYKKFWTNFESHLSLSLRTGEIAALNSLKLKKKRFKWYDAGNIDSLNQIKKISENKNFNILDKEDELIWFVNNRVIKFHKDSRLIKKKVNRSNKLNNFVPKVIFHKKNLFCYNYIEGKTFSENKKKNNFELLLKYSKIFWKKKKLSTKENLFFNDRCQKFYKLKTINRISAFLKKYKITRKEELINGYKTENIFKLLKKINWQNISNGMPARFHGDYHFENIIFSHNKFSFIDWRQDFSGFINYGDIYYDLAKLLHGIIVSHKIVNNNEFSYIKKDNKITVSIKKMKNYQYYLKNYKAWIIKNEYDLKKIEILTALIYLNIAVLHHHPYDKFLFYYGKLYLHTLLKNDAKKKN
jgi:CTP:phosphocholine cytidylyltransferase-like protein